MTTAGRLKALEFEVAALDRQMEELRRMVTGYEELRRIVRALEERVRGMHYPELPPAGIAEEEVADATA
jgi:hypothetical protein